MASSDKISKQVFSSASLSRDGSKAQMCLKKIITFIHTISSATLSDDMNLESQAKINEKKIDDGSSSGKKGLGLDLNLRLSSCSENGVTSACSGVGEDDDDDDCRIIEKWSFFGSGSKVYKSHEGEGVGECDLNTGSGSGERQPPLSHCHIRTVEESSGITHLEENEIIKAGKRKQKEVITEEEQSESLRNEGYLDLLVEAARMVSAESIEDAEENNIKKGKKVKKPSQIEISQPVAEENEKWIFEDDISPLVRSRRGRNQVLPCRYRDSIIEPLKKETPKQKQRSSSRVSVKSRKKKD